MKYILILLSVLMLGSCTPQVVDKSDFDKCIEVGNECVQIGWKLSRQKDSLNALLAAYQYAEMKNKKVFGSDERFLRVNAAHNQSK